MSLTICMKKKIFTTLLLFILFPATHCEQSSVFELLSPIYFEETDDQPTQLKGFTLIESGDSHLYKETRYDKFFACLANSLTVGTGLGISLGCSTLFLHRHCRRPSLFTAIMSWMLAGYVGSIARKKLFKIAQNHNIPYNKSLCRSSVRLTFWATWLYLLGYLR